MWRRVSTNNQTLPLNPISKSHFLPPLRSRSLYSCCAFLYHGFSLFLTNFYPPFPFFPQRSVFRRRHSSVYHSASCQCKMDSARTPLAKNGGGAADPQNAKIQKVREQLNEVQGVMQNNIDAAIARGENIDALGLYQTHGVPIYLFIVPDAPSTHFFCFPFDSSRTYATRVPVLQA